MIDEGRRRVAGDATDQWAEVLVALRGLDRIPLRRIVTAVLRDVAPVLRDSSPDLVAADPLRGWHRLSQAMTPGQEQPLDAFVAAFRFVEAFPAAGIASFMGGPRDAGSAPAERPWDGTIDWDDRAAGAVDMLLALLPEDDDDSGALALLVLAFCYVECIVFWEYTTDHDPLRSLLVVIRDRADARAAAEPPGEVRRLLGGVALATVALGHQFDVENGWGCGCPVKVTSTAGQAVDALGEAQRRLRTGGDAPDAAVFTARRPCLRGATAGIADVLAESIDDPHRYFTLLRDHVGPAAAAFSENLFDRADDATVRAQLRAARDEVRRLAGPQAGEDGAGPQIMGVFRSEARAQGRALDGMLSVVGGDGDDRDGDRGGGEATAQPTVVVDRAEIHYLYPFGLPIDDAGEDDVKRKLVEHFRGVAEPAIRIRPELAGCRVTVEDALQTEALAQASGVIEPGSGGRAGARLVFADDHLVLESSAGVRYGGLDVEVILGSLSNHLVRIAVTTETPVAWCSAGADHPRAEACSGAFTPIPSQWTPHELDGFMHRGGMDFGPERLYFVPNDAPLPHSPAPDRPTWTSIIELAATIVSDLHSTLAHDPDHGDAAPDGRHGAEDWSSQLRRQAHVLTVVADASSVLAGGREPIATPADLAACHGAGPLLTTQPPFPRVLEEWTCAPPHAAGGPGDAERDVGLLGSMDSQIVCNGDTTLMFVPFSPNWQLIEDRELVMFALSLGSAYVLARDRLLASAEQAVELHTSEELTLHTRDTLEALDSRVHAAEQQLTRSISFADELLDHARGAVVIRPRRDRILLDHLSERSGVAELQAAMTSTRQTAFDRLLDLRDVAGRIAEAGRRRGEVWMTRLLLAVAVLGFIDGFWWYFDIQRDEYAWNWSLYFAASIGALALVGAVIVVVVFRAGARSRSRPG